MTVAEFREAGLHTLDSIGKLAARAPEDQVDWRPCEGCMTLGQLLEHAATSLTPVVEIAITGEMPPPMTPEQLSGGEQLKSIAPGDVAPLIERQKSKLVEVLEQVDDEQWRTVERTLPWGTHGTLGRLCVEGIDHASGHRYQLFLYLKMLGQKLGTMELYGMA